MSDGRLWPVYVSGYCYWLTEDEIKAWARGKREAFGHRLMVEAVKDERDRWQWARCARKVRTT